ncbi:MAG TPA: uroporphyrinogen decarboxylase family protein [Armatimonadota bacterium]|jgi:hypothetical protein
MTLRENLSRALRGEEVEQIPFAIYGSFFNSSVGEQLRDIPDMGTIGMARAWTVEYSAVEVTTETLPDGGDLTTYHTPLGDLWQRRTLDPVSGSMWIMEHLVKQPEDWRLVQYLLEDAQYAPQPEFFDEQDEKIGEDGIVMAPVERMPFQRLWIEFGDIEQLCFLLADDRNKLDRMISSMTKRAVAHWKLTAASDAEFVWCPDNLTSDIMGPELFRRYAQPYYEALADVMHPAHKRLIAHFDGHLAVLKDLIAETPIDVIESFTPPPNGNLRLGEAWEAWRDKVIWVNYPPAEHLHDPEEIKSRIRGLVAEAGHRRRLAFEISEDVPLDLAPTNFAAIAEALAEL